MQSAIVSSIIPPTQTLGQRIQVRIQIPYQLVSLMFPYDHALSLDENHLAAAMEFAEVQGYDASTLHGAVLPSGDVAWIQVKGE